MGYRFSRQIVYWCKKQGNKFHQKGKCNSPIFSTETAYALVEVLNIGLLHLISVDISVIEKQDKNSKKVICHFPLTK